MRKSERNSLALQFLEPMQRSCGPTQSRSLRTYRVSPLGRALAIEKFGDGTVREVDGNKLEIDFEHAGVKTIMDIS